MHNKFALEPGTGLPMNGQDIVDPMESRLVPGKSGAFRTRRPYFEILHFNKDTGVGLANFEGSLVSFKGKVIYDEPLQSQCESKDAI